MSAGLFFKLLLDWTKIALNNKQISHPFTVSFHCDSAKVPASLTFETPGSSQRPALK